MFQSALKRLFCVAAVAVAVTLSSTDSAQAGWHHWGGYVGYGYYSSYYAPVYYAPAYSIGYRRSCLSHHAYYSPVVYPSYSYYTPVYSSCYAPCYRSCYSPCYSSCCNTCYGPCACSSCCGVAVDCCGSGTVVQKHSTTPDAEPTLAPQESAAPPAATPPAPAALDPLPPAPDPAEPTSVLPDPAANPGLELPPMPSSPAAPPLPGDAQNQSGVDSAVLSVVVPSDARVYVNGNLTSTPGTHRQFVSHGLVRGYEYTYEIQAVVNRGGHIVTDKQVVHVRAGETRDLAMNLNSSPATAAIATSLKIYVPDNAQVQLEGLKTKATGAVRQYSTTGLAKGERWDDYRVVVTLNQNGRPVTQEKTLSMVGGESHELRFDFADQLASR